MTTPDDASTGLPLLRTWRAVYAFVFIIFLIVVGLLIALSKAFS